MGKMKEQLYKTKKHYEKSGKVHECVLRKYSTQTQCMNCFMIWDNDEKRVTCPKTKRIMEV